jgi:carboxypeptidase PM20D1
MLKKILLILGSVLLLLIIVVIFNTLRLPTYKSAHEPVTPVEVPDLALERFQTSITFPTVSYIEKEKRDTAAFLGLLNHLAESYPLVEQNLEKTIINQYSLLYKWKGKNPNAKAVVMMAHLDVVPVDESTPEAWDAPPFSGEIKDGIIYGRGTMDDKINVIALLEAAELLIKEGFQPAQDIYFSFGHDEEIGGKEGAKEIAEYLAEKNTDIAFAIDEGGLIAEDMVAGFSRPLALVNVGEKGFVSFKLTIQTDGGHSSDPPPDNTIGSLARAIVKLEESQFEYEMTPLVEEQLNAIGSGFDQFTYRMAFANLWLFKPFLLKSINAHTTIAPTMISGGVKDNVIPTQASAVVNFRIMSGGSVEGVRQHIIQTIDDDRIEIEPISNVDEPSPVSETQSASFKIIEKTIVQLFPDAVVAPGLLGAGTDSKHFIGVADNVYRFYPTRINPTNRTGFHGNNEHISVENYFETIQFNYQLIRNLAELE